MAAARAIPLASWIWPGASGAPGGCSSSPVDRIATRGRRRTASSPTPREASRPRVAAVSSSLGRVTASPGARVVAGATDVGARLGGGHDHVRLPLLHHLDRRHRVRARRHRSAGHDPCRRARPDLGQHPRPGGHLTDQPQPAGRVRRAQRVAVHRRVVEGRHVNGRGELEGRRRAAEARIQGQDLGLRHPGHGQDAGQGLLDRAHRLRRRASVACRPGAGCRCGSAAPPPCGHRPPPRAAG